MLIRCLNQYIQVFIAILVVGKDVTLVHTALYDVHRQALNKRSVMPSHTAKGGGTNSENRRIFVVSDTTNN